MRLREVHNPPMVTELADAVTSTLAWGAEGAFWRGRSCWDRGCLGRGRAWLSPTDPGHWASHPISVFYPAVPAAVPAPSGPQTVTDYPRDPGDRGGNIWILLQGLAGDLGVGVLRQI